MPELPEVEVVRRGIETWATDAIITAVEVLDERSLRRHPAGAADFSARLRKQRLMTPQRRGKYLWIPLAASHDAVVVHLGMSGQVLIAAPGLPDPKHLKIRLTIVNNGHVQELRFVDQRIFGGLYLDELVKADDVSGQHLPTTVTHIGRDPLDEHFDPELIFRKLRRRKSNIKRALLDQSLSSGIGNIYADEALFDAQLHFSRPTETLTRKEVSRVYSAAEQVMRLALSQGGTSFDALYVNVEGEAGYFDRSLTVYQREGKACYRCQTAGIETRILRSKLMNRSSYFCPKCQPVPRRARG